jgi:hypothetical protein
VNRSFSGMQMLLRRGEKVAGGLLLNLDKNFPARFLLLFSAALVKTQNFVRHQQVKDFELASS